VPPENAYTVAALAGIGLSASRKCRSAADVALGEGLMLRPDTGASSEAPVGVLGSGGSTRRFAPLNTSSSLCSIITSIA